MSPRPAAPPWYAPFAATALAADTLGAFVPVLLTFSLSPGLAAHTHPLAAAVAAASCWTAVRAVHRRYGRRTLGESRGLLATAHDWCVLLGALAVLRAVTDERTPVPATLLALLPALLVTGVAGMAIHHHLTRQRHRARAVRRVLLVGEAGPADAVAARLAARTDHAYVVVGSVPVGRAELAGGVPAAGRLPADAAPRPGTDLVPDGPDGSTVVAAARRHDADLVLVVPGRLLTGERLRRLAWAVHDAGLALVVAAGLTDVAPRRVRVENAAGLAMLHVTPPVRGGAQPLLKSAFDRTAAGLGLVLLAPLLGLIALAVRLDSPGPALYRQTRIGRGGEPFTLWKFRTMVSGAESLRPALLGANDHTGGPMFKMRRDPRITRVGRLLRRTSLDELPQLVNVLRGQMALVGPRPPLPEEVAAYGVVELRRLGVKPGLTGLWQVSGRSELSWDEGLALDLSYADNWSLTGDLDVLARTVRAVIDGRGAY